MDIDPQYLPDVVADVMALPFPNHSAGTIYAGHLLEHIPLVRLPAALEEWRRVLRQDGELVIVGPDIDKAVEQNEPYWLLKQIIAHGEGPGAHAWTCSAGVLLAALLRCGWSAEEVDVATIRSPEYPNAEPDASWQVAFVCRP